MRNENLPRQSDIKHFLDEGELEAIPEEILDEASERGIENHDIIEKNYDEPSDNIISNMFKEGVSKIFTSGELQEKPVFEEQLNGPRFTGKPDFRLGNALVDYKFSIELRKSTALQLVLYEILEEEVNSVKIDKHFAFHFPKDRGLFIHKVPELALEPLHEYAEYIIDNHEAIKGGELERYHAITKWDKLLQDYTVFEPVAQVLPPLTINSEADAIAAAVIFYNIKAVTDYENKLKRELKRWMSENDKTKIEDAFGFGVQFVKRENKMYDTSKKAIAKAIYDNALEECQTGIIENFSLRRVKPRVKKPKLIK